MGRVKTKLDYLLFMGALLLLSLNCSCSKESEDIVEQPEINRVVLFYAGGDNSLSSEVYHKVEYIAKGWSESLKGRILVYADAKDRAPQLLEITSAEKDGYIVIEEYPEQNSADSEVFRSVFQQVEELYPNKPMGLIIFSHGTGWLPKGAFAAPRSIIEDGDDEMEIVDLARAIPDGRLDFIIFEACLMAGVEVAYELREKTDYILASSAEILSPGFTYIYPYSMEQLFTKEHVAEALDEFAKSAYHYFNMQMSDGQSSTLSLCDTRQLNKLADFIKLRADHSREVDWRTIQHFGSIYPRLYFDFEDYYSELIDDEEGELRGLIEQCIISKYATKRFLGSYDIESHSGLTCYIPQERLPELNASYKETSWAKYVRQER